MRIAIVGTGIAGLTAARRLHARHELTVFEADARIGGHTHTVDVEQAGGRWAVDTGFIVFNDWTYPGFIALMDEIGVASKPSEMSFSVRCEESGLEYCGSSLDRLFAQRRNLVSPGFWRMLADILRFNRTAPTLLTEAGGELGLGEWLASQGYSRRFVEQYVIPMGAAIWSTDPATMRAFPARFFVRFFANHGMLSVNDRPAWRVIEGGSRSYLAPLIAPFADRIRTATPVRRLTRPAGGVELVLGDGSRARFDAVVLACHSDQALALLADAEPSERTVLGALPYQSNRVVLHTDARLLPRRRKAWAAWNYQLPAARQDGVAVTYDMNILQGLDAPVEFLVSLNPPGWLDERRVLREFAYEHPVYTPEGMAARERLPAIQGARRTFFCGAWCGFGFHEDGVQAGLAAARAVDEWSRHAELPLRRAG